MVSAEKLSMMAKRRTEGDKCILDSRQEAYIVGWWLMAPKGVRYWRRLRFVLEKFLAIVEWWRCQWPVTYKLSWRQKAFLFILFYLVHQYIWCVSASNRNNVAWVFPWRSSALCAFLLRRNPTHSHHSTRSGDESTKRTKSGIAVWLRGTCLEQNLRIICSNQITTSDRFPINPAHAWIYIWSEIFHGM